MKYGAAKIGQQSLQADNGKIYEIIDQIDQGGSNVVFIIALKNDKSIKYVSKRALTEKSDKNWPLLLKEAEFIERFSGCPEIIQSQGICDVFNNTTQQWEKHLVLENCIYGNLHQICMFTKFYEETSSFVVMSALCRGLSTLHSKNVLHLDIKESNILINFNKDNLSKKEFACLPIEFKISDLGIAQDYVPNKSYENSQFRAGTIKYMAPEQISHVRQKVDPLKLEIFSLGVILYKLILKKYPFSPNSFQDVNARDSDYIRKQLQKAREQENRNISIELEDLLCGMLAYNPQQRLSLQQVQNSQWFKIHSDLLMRDKEVQEKTRNQLFQKFSYVLNITKVKIDIKQLINKQSQEQKSQTSLVLTYQQPAQKETPNQYDLNNNKPVVENKFKIDSLGSNGFLSLTNMFKKHSDTENTSQFSQLQSLQIMGM